jgi:hypothetical protein
MIEAYLWLMPVLCGVSLILLFIYRRQPYIVERVWKTALIIGLLLTFSVAISLAID